MRMLPLRRSHPLTRATLVGLLLLAILAVLQSCGGASDAEAAEAEAAGPPRFVVVNHSGEAIKDIAVKANMMIRFRDLSPGESSTMSDAQLRVPRQLSIRWTDSGGNHHFDKRSTDDLGDRPTTCRFVINDRQDAVLGP
ncbi:MAG: hypothetical protein ACOC3G_01035 [Phycisphaeraceae bacterium]